MTSQTVRVLTSFALLTLACQPAGAQPAVSISVAGGAASHGSAEGLEAMMGAAGLGHGAPSFFSRGEPSTRGAIAQSCGGARTFACGFVPS
jgi:hypothetical protein